MGYMIERIREHFEVYDSFGRFLFSADSRGEIEKELETFVSVAQRFYTSLPWECPNDVPLIKFKRVRHIKLPRLSPVCTDRNDYFLCGDIPLATPPLHPQIVF